MWYTLPYANTIMYTPAHGGRAGNLGGRSPVLVRLYGPALPDPPRQCRGTVNHHDCTPTPLYRSNGPQHHSCVPPAGSRRAAASLIAAAHPVDHLRCRDLRVPPSTPPSESADVRQAYQRVDPPARRRGQFRRGPDAALGQRLVDGLRNAVGKSRIVGDVAFDEASKVAGAITPVARSPPPSSQRYVAPRNVVHSGELIGSLSELTSRVQPAAGGVKCSYHEAVRCTSGFNGAVAGQCI